MTGIHPNLLLQPPAPGGVPHSARPSAADLRRRSWLDVVKDIGKSAKQTASKPLLMMGLNINPFGSTSPGPADALRRINESAARGLQCAAIRGVKEESDLVGGRLQAELDRILIPRAPGTPRTEPAGAVGPVAVIPDVPVDPEVTKAIPLQARVDATNWETKTTEHRDALIDKLSAFSAVLEMRERAGIKEKNNSKLLKIVDKATKKGETKSLWDLFVEQYEHYEIDGETYELSASQKGKAGWVYWAYYQTSLISNTVRAYVGKALENMTKDLISDDNQSRLKLIRKLLENTNEFLVEDIRATKEFAYATEPGGGDLEKFRKRAIEKHYGNSLEDLCKAFSEKRVQEDCPTVPFFSGKLKNIPVIGLVFKLFEWLINRFIIQKSMKSSILPPALKSAIENAQEAAQPQNLPFSLAMTRFLTGQLEKLRTKLEDGTATVKPTHLPGTELLSPAIKNLKLVLDLEPLKTQPELRQKFAEIEAGKGFLDKQLEKIIEEGIQDGCHHLFEYLNEAAKSRELFAHMLELSCTAFSDQSKGEAVLRAEFQEEQLKLKRATAGVFQNIIHTAVTKIVNGTKPEDAKQMAKNAFDDGQTVAKRTFDELKILSDRMTQKIDRSSQAPTAENSVQSDIAAFLQIMQVFANRKEIVDRINELQEVDREAIWVLVTPIYERAVKLQEKVLLLQELQDHYPSHVAVAGQLRLIKQHLTLVHNQFHTQPRHFPNPFIQTLEETCAEIGKSLGERAPATTRLRSYIKSISDLSKNIAKEQQILDALHDLSPPREAGEEGAEGLLDQLLLNERGIQVARQPRTILADVSKCLECFPPEEQRELRELIDDGSNLSVKLFRLAPLLQRIYEGHKAVRDQDSTQLDETLRAASTWTTEKIEKYNSVKNQDHAEMKKVMREIGTEVTHLRTDAYRVQLDLPFYFSSGQTKVATTLAGAGLGWGLTSLGHLVGGPIGTAIGAGLGALSYVGSQNLSGLLSRKPKAIGKSAATLVGGTLLSYLFPNGAALAGAAGGAMTGLKVEQALHANAEDKVLPEIQELFNNAYELMRAPRVVHGGATRAVKALTAG